MSGATTEQIVATVQKCPSGALSYELVGESAAEEAASDVIRAEVVPNGPLIVYGSLLVKDAAGNAVRRDKSAAFCRCGKSKAKPFCDGSHVEAGFSD